MSSKFELLKRSGELLSSGFEKWRDIWQSATDSLEHGYFLSWPWTQHWLEKLPLEIDVRLLVADAHGGRAVCLLGHGIEKRHGFITSDSYYLNHSGQAPFDDVTLEYNLIASRHPSVPLLQAVLSSLPKDFDELHLPALDARGFPGNCIGSPLAGYHCVVHREEPCPNVDLNGIRGSEDEYLRALSRNTRASIRRAKNGLARIGPVRLIDAENLGAAHEIFDELVGLHQAAWQRRGRAGAFAAKWFLDFHRSLIEKRFDSGEVQLLRVECNGETVGCLYNFVYKGDVIYYQSGINYQDFGNYKPGFVCHALAVPYNSSLGHRRYDFLAGGSRYKQILSTHSNRLIWCTIQKPRLFFRLERLAKAAKAHIRSKQFVARENVIQ